MPKSYNGTPCWFWPEEKVDTNGYARCSFEEEEQVHRVTYRLLAGFIPEEFYIDHLCRNRSCVNPLHMEAVPNGTNVLRGNGIAALNARKTHCKRGHRFTKANTIIRFYYRNNGDGVRRQRRVCRTCENDYQRERKRTLRQGG